MLVFSQMRLLLEFAFGGKWFNFHGSELSDLRQNRQKTEAHAAHTCTFKHALCFCKDNSRPRGNLMNLCQSAVPILSSQPATYAPSFPTVCSVCPFFIKNASGRHSFGLGTARHPIMHFTTASNGGKFVLKSVTVHVWTAEVHQNEPAYCEIFQTGPEMAKWLHLTVGGWSSSSQLLQPTSHHLQPRRRCVHHHSASPPGV